MLIFLAFSGFLGLLYKSPPAETRLTVYCWLLIWHHQNTTYSLPPSDTDTTPRAECFATVWNQHNSRLTVHHCQTPTQPHVRNALQTYENNIIQGWQFASVRNLHNPTCGMFCKCITLTEYHADILPPSETSTTPRAACFANVWD